MSTKWNIYRDQAVPLDALVACLCIQLNDEMQAIEFSHGHSAGERDYDVFLLRCDHSEDLNMWYQACLAARKLAETSIYK